ncbi:MAG: glycoside hydrolase 43 family protein [Acidobacteriota bacterium]|nr:glycoside hydrolase 43 family protein [Acidobacteriota bacterium]
MTNYILKIFVLMKCELFRALLSVVACALLFVLSSPNKAQISITESPISKVWVADRGDGTYKNPILHADYSDPDVIRVGDDFYLTASSFNFAPGLPVLHSKDLVNWKIVNYVFVKQKPFAAFDQPQHGNGVWAPSIRFHNGEFYIFYPDPDRGIYLTKAKNPAGEWSEPVLIKEAKGWIDPCPLWDADGNAYLLSALAASRSGIKSVLIVSRMSVDGTRLLDDGAIVFDGHDKHPTVEGPKFYRRNGFYYIFAPAGGVETGWQIVLRSKNIYGPYEEKIVLAQGKTEINGPHQGAWVETQTGESWFLHFQDKNAFGRVVHLQPVIWKNDFPVIGADADGDGTGEPVLTFKKPNVGKTYPITTPMESDEFNAPRIGWQWQWQANPQTNWWFSAPSYGFLRLFNRELPENSKNFWDVPNVLLQKFPAPNFTATTKVTFTPRTDGEKTGLIITGLDYAYVSVEKRPEGLFVSQTIVKDAEKGTAEIAGAGVAIKNNVFYLRVKVTEDSRAQFAFSTNGKTFTNVGEPFTARKGKWVGARVGIFAVRTGKTRETGYANFDWFRIE